MEKNKLISEEAIKLLNYRIQQEELSARLYESMSLYLNYLGMFNASKLYKKYSEEERTHSEWSKAFLLDRDAIVELDDLEAPPCEFKSFQEIAEKTLEHELEITRQCEELTKKAMEWGNFALMTLGLKYCAEQQEEIGKATNLLNILKLSTDNLVIDQYIGENFLD